VLTLAIETSSSRGSVAIARGPQVLVELAHESPSAHAEQLLPLLEQALGRAGVERGHLERVGVGLGPGSFTGLRVGIAFGQGIAAGLSIPLFGVPSLANLALAGRGTTAAERGDGAERLYGGLLDARRGEYFFAAYDLEGREVIPAQTVAQNRACERLKELAGDRQLTVAGLAALAACPAAWRCQAPGSSWPSAGRTATLIDSPHATSAVAPMYLRDADAKIPSLPANPLLPSLRAQRRGA
jgi:tRNA threonylcarbamoyladenosine biosynthesis protein TsaB